MQGRKNLPKKLSQFDCRTDPEEKTFTEAPQKTLTSFFIRYKELMARRNPSIEPRSLFKLLLTIPVRIITSTGNWWKHSVCNDVALLSGFFDIDERICRAFNDQQTSNLPAILLREMFNKSICAGWQRWWYPRHTNHGFAPIKANHPLESVVENAGSPPWQPLKERRKKIRKPRKNIGETYLPHMSQVLHPRAETRKKTTTKIYGIIQ